MSLNSGIPIDPAVAHQRGIRSMEMTRVSASQGVRSAVAVGHDAVIVGGAIWGLAPGEGGVAEEEPAFRAEVLDEEALELLAEDDVDDEVDGGVDGDEEVGGLDELVDDEVVEGLEDVVDEGQEVAEEEDDHDAEQHRRQPDLFLLQTGEPLSLLIRPSHLQQVSHLFKCFGYC